MGRAYEVRKASIQKNGAARGKIYTIFAKEIYLAAKNGIPEIESNVDLKRLVDKAKKNQVPADIIERAINKAKTSGTEDYKEVIYEGFGPGASTIMIKCLTDNVNRSISSIREAFNKTHNKLGAINAVSYNYDHSTLLSFKYDDADKVLEHLLEAGIDVIDLDQADDEIILTLKPSDYHKAKDALEALIPNIDYNLDETGYYAHDKVKLNSEDEQNFQRLIDLLNNVDDVSEVYHNVDFGE